MNITVLGGAGFIGGNLCHDLIVSGHRVTCIDSFVTGIHSSIARLVGNQNFNLITHDIRQTIPRHDCDCVINLACPASPHQYLKYKKETIESCTLGVINSVEFATASNARLVHASSSEIYGDIIGTLSETCLGTVNTLGSRSCYSESKRISETIVETYSHLNNVQYVIIRLFNVYGPGMGPSDGRVLPNMLNSILYGDKFLLHGNGGQQRSFCYITDVIRALQLIINSNYTGVLNIGNPEPISIIKLGEKLEKISGLTLNTVSTDRDPDDPDFRTPDISKIHEVLGWYPEVTLDDGLKLYFQWRKNNYLNL